MKALLLICHGSRTKAGMEKALEFAKRCMGASDYPIKEVCFLELSAPDISKGVEACVRQGAASICAIPVLLLTAAHAKKDIPEEIMLQQERYPNVEISYGKPFGVHDSLSHLLWERITESVDTFHKNAVILLVGRGSSDPDVKRDLNAIAANLQKNYEVPRVETCFLTAAQPSFEEMLRLSGWGYQQIIVVPYLLFPGILLSGMKNAIAQQQNQSDQNFILCEALGYHPVLQDVLSTRIEEAEMKSAVV
ncbi:sirohydrochlorin chelatase [Fictibacillus sp. KU28468]|uniref:sirohydrochlorin chelatase n=1 Tax=Fictibacillus sp. KU28468 TaxID=2991053 RepID=UPI00223D7A37|nr:sirohydrochlorin chelatase [Fictibacillus sp. KU28468]UZJ79917.1 sirohydrochlorin chelatase [Fictibacillus sp. KU28468]